MRCAIFRFCYIRNEKIDWDLLPKTKHDKRFLFLTCDKTHP